MGLLWEGWLPGDGLALGPVAEALASHWTIAKP